MLSIFNSQSEYFTYYIPAMHPTVKVNCALSIQFIVRNKHSDRVYGRNASESDKDS